MIVNVKDYKKLILKTLYKGFLRNPPNRINNADVDSAFGKINKITNFKIAREQLIRDDFIYGKNVNFGNPPYFEITGNGLVHYENNYIIPSVNREYTLLVSKILVFLRDLGNKKYDISKYVKEIDKRHKQVKMTHHYINQVLKNDYDYKMNNLKWMMLYFTSRFVSNHIMEINGIGVSNDYLSFNNSETFCLNAKGYNFLNDVFLKEKFQMILNDDGRNRVIQLYDDLKMWISKERWVDVAVNMGAIIEYCIDNYIDKKGKKKLQFFLKDDKFMSKVNFILQNPNNNSDPIFLPQYRATWKRIQNVLRDWRNYVHISKLVKERSPLDKKSIQKFYGDFELIINILLNL